MRLSDGFLSANTCVVCMVALLTAGCATNRTVRQAPVEQDRSFLIPEDCSTVGAALPAALASLKLKVEGTAPDLTTCPISVITRKGISPFSWGEIVRIGLAPVEPGSTELRVYTERALATNITARGDWSEYVYEALLSQLADSGS